MKPLFFYLDIVAENGGRSHTEVTVCMHGQHTQESMDGPGMVAIPAHGRITFSTLRLNIVLPRGIPAAFHEGVHIYTANRYWVSPKFIGSLPRVRWHIISKRVFPNSCFLSELNISYLHAERARVMRASSVSRDDTMWQAL